MPSIRKNVKQQKAIEEITQNINVLRVIHSVKEENINSITISFNTGSEEHRRGRKKIPSITLPVTEKITVNRIMGAIGAYKDRLTKESVKMAEKYEIAFSDDEKELLDGKMDQYEDETVADQEEETQCIYPNTMEIPTTRFSTEEPIFNEPYYPTRE